MLTPNDSGTAAAPVVYCAADGQQVVLSGGCPVTSAWKTEDGKVFHLDLPEARNGQWRFKQLFVNGRRATRARYPNGNATIKVVKDGEDKLTLHVEPGTAKASWAESSEALINLIAEAGWFNELVQVASVSPDGSVIKIKGKEAQGQIRAGNQFFVEGVQAELDQPGEWHLDTVAGRLYYWPENGDPSKLQIVAPVLDRAVELAGDHSGPARVEYITLRGFTFTDLDYTVGHVAMRTTQDAAVRLMNAWHCGIEDSRFSNIGGYGVWLHLDSRYNRVVGNEMAQTGSGGVLTTSARFAYATDDMVYDPDPAVAHFAPLRNEISHNHIHDGGVIRRYCAGVHLDSRPLSTALEAGNLVAHNHIHDMPRNGIFAFANQGGNIFEYNDIHDVIQVVDDGGGIHIATMNPLAAPIFVRGNLLRHIGPEGVLANGVYPDWFTSNLRVENNIIYHTSKGGVKILGGDHIALVNNIIADDTLASIVAVYFGVSQLTGNEIERNIILNKRTNTTAVRFSAYPVLSKEEAVHNPQVFAVMNHNLYWNPTGPVRFFVNGKGGDALLDFGHWQATGADRASAEADPLFVDRANGNFGLKAGSPAKQLGFVPIDMSQVGPGGQTVPSVSFDQIQQDASFASNEDIDLVETSGACSIERVVLAGQKHTFLTQLVLQPAISEPGFIRLKPRVASSGEYDVWVRWFPSQKPNSSKTLLTFATASGPQRIVLDQTKEAIKWLRLGAYRFEAGADAGMTFSGEAAGGSPGAVAVKAVALVKKKPVGQKS